MAEELTENDEFWCEEVNTWITKKKLFSWGYRDKNGILHTGMATSFEKAIEEAKKYGFTGDCKSNLCPVKGA